MLWWWWIVVILALSTGGVELYTALRYNYMRALHWCGALVSLYIALVVMLAMLGLATGYYIQAGLYVSLGFAMFMILRLIDLWMALCCKNGYG